MNVRILQNHAASWVEQSCIITLLCLFKPQVWWEGSLWVVNNWLTIRWRHTTEVNVKTKCFHKMKQVWVFLALKFVVRKFLIGYVQMTELYQHINVTHRLTWAPNNTSRRLLLTEGTCSLYVNCLLCERPPLGIRHWCHDQMVVSFILYTEIGTKRHGMVCPTYFLIRLCLSGFNDMFWSVSDIQRRSESLTLFLDNQYITGPFLASICQPMR